MTEKWSVKSLKSLIPQLNGKSGVDLYVGGGESVISPTPLTDSLEHPIPGWRRCRECNEGAPARSLDNLGLCIVCDEELSDDQKERISIELEAIG